MPWETIVAIVGGLLGTLGVLSQALGRETVGELKRRVGMVEVDGAARALVVASLQAEQRGMKQQLDRIETLMVPRSEWTSRHDATDALLERVSGQLDRLRDSSQEDPHPPRRRLGDPRRE